MSEKARNTALGTEAVVKTVNDEHRKERFVVSYIPLCVPGRERAYRCAEAVHCGLFKGPLF